VSGQAASRATNAYAVSASEIVLTLQFEEFFVSRYLITTLKQWKDPRFVINVSVTVRLLDHSYPLVSLHDALCPPRVLAG
jgi:hypothetical protein